MAAKENPAALVGADRAGVLQAEHAVDTRDILKRQAQHRLGAGGIIVALMREVESLRPLRAENDALRDENHALQEKIDALWEEIHLRGDVDAALSHMPEKRIEVAQTYIARTTYRLANQRAPAKQIKAAVLAEAARVDYPSKAAIRLASAILDEWAAEHG
jgi:hypothetical protein